MPAGPVACPLPAATRAAGFTRRVDDRRCAAGHGGVAWVPATGGLRSSAEPL